MAEPLTDAELSLKIAEYFGWVQRADGDWTSPKGWRGCSFTERYTGLPDMVNDPAMTVMLIEKLFASRVCEISIEKHSGTMPDIRIVRAITGDACHKGSGILGRAIAESFARTKGIV